MPLYSGPVAGGPLHGRKDWTKAVETIMVPVVSAAGPIVYGFYRWHSLVRMWIWDGPRGPVINAEAQRKYFPPTPPSKL